MSADLQIHVLEGATESDLAKFNSNTFGSKYFNPVSIETPCFEEPWYKRITKTPSVWVGEVSWLKAALLGGDDFIPMPIQAVDEAIGEDLPVIDEALIGRIEAAMGTENRTQYRIADPNEVLTFLRQHLGKQVFTLTW